MKNNLAFVFPGQGSQKTGMLSELAEFNPIIEETFSQASEVLGYDLWKMSQEGTQEQINLTERTQPLLLASSVSVWRVWTQRNGSMPGLLAGHSLGEWSALVCAGAVKFEDAIGIVRSRGALMQDAVPVGIGAMAAIIGLDDEAICQSCADARGDEVVDAVNFNAPGQVVIAGSANAVGRAIELCKAAGAKRALQLPVSAPFHTSLMAPASDGLTDQVRSVAFSAPEIPVIHNVHGQSESDPAAIKQLMLEQIYSPVRWVDCVLELRRRGAKQFVECGPGRVLSGLSKRIDKEIVSFSTDDVAGLENALAAV